MLALTRTHEVTVASKPKRRFRASIDQNEATRIRDRQIYWLHREKKEPTADLAIAFGLTQRHIRNIIAEIRGVLEGCGLE